MALSFLKDKIASAVNTANNRPGGAPVAAHHHAVAGGGGLHHADPSAAPPAHDGSFTGPNGSFSSSASAAPLTTSDLLRRIETLEVEKKLLQDLIDRAFEERADDEEPSAATTTSTTAATATQPTSIIDGAGEPNDDALSSPPPLGAAEVPTPPQAPSSTAAITPQRAVREWMASHASALAAAASMQSQIDDIHSQLIRAEKRCKAFEAALTMAQQELKDSDAQVQQLRDEAQRAAQLAKDKQSLDEKCRRLEAQVADSHATITELMSKVSRTGDDKSQREKELSSIIAKTAQQSDEQMQELEARNAQLQAALAEIARLRAAPPPPVPTEVIEARVEQERVLRQQLEERLHAQRTAELEDVVAQHAAALAAKEFKHRDSIAVLELLAEQRLDVDNIRADESEDLASDVLGVLLASAERRWAQLDDENAALRATLEQLQIQATALADELGCAAARESDLQHRVAEVERELHDTDAQNKAQQRVAQTLTRDLKGQLSRLEQQLQRANEDLATAQMLQRVPRPDAAEPQSNAAHERETAELIKRNVGLQEEVWCLKQTKEAYEVEMVRLNEEIAAKTAVIRAHVVDEATRAAQANSGAGGAGKRFGASFFGPKADEIAPEIQKMLEAALFENLQLRTQNQHLSRVLERAQHALDAAVEQGYGRRVDGDEGDEADGSPANQHGGDVPLDDDEYDDKFQ